MLQLSNSVYSVGMAVTKHAHPNLKKSSIFNRRLLLHWEVLFIWIRAENKKPSASRDYFPQILFSLPHPKIREFCINYFRTIPALSFPKQSQQLPKLSRRLPKIQTHSTAVISTISPRDEIGHCFTRYLNLAKPRTNQHWPWHTQSVRRVIRRWRFEILRDGIFC